MSKYVNAPLMVIRASLSAAKAICQSHPRQVTPTASLPSEPTTTTDAVTADGADAATDVTDSGYPSAGDSDSKLELTTMDSFQTATQVQPLRDKGESRPTTVDNTDVDSLPCCRFCGTHATTTTTAVARRRRKEDRWKEVLEVYCQRSTIHGVNQLAGSGGQSVSLVRRWGHFGVENVVGVDLVVAEKLKEDFGVFSFSSVSCFRHRFFLLLFWLPFISLLFISSLFVTAVSFLFSIH